MAKDIPGRSRLVAGEPAEALARALLQLKTETMTGGWVHLDVQLDRKEGAPLARALMRVEAELLLHDADNISVDGRVASRTPAQRRADAFLALVLRVGDAIAS